MYVWFYNRRYGLKSKERTGFFNGNVSEILFACAKLCAENRGDEKIAEDMAQETFIRLIPKAARLKTMKEPVYVSYLITAVKRVSADHLRSSENKRFKDSLLFSEDDYTNLPSDLPDTAESAVQNLSAEKMKDAIPKLPQKYRDVLLFKYLLGMSDREIGKMLGISPGSVRQYLTRARRMALEIYEKGKHR